MHAAPITFDFAEALDAKIPTYEFTCRGGRKFDKILIRGRNSTQTLIHVFVERATGKLIKPASFSAPQQDKDGPAYRYDISTPEGFQQALEVADFAGSYLYAGYEAQ